MGFTGSVSNHMWLYLLVRCTQRCGVFRFTSTFFFFHLNTTSIFSVRCQYFDVER